MLFACQRGIVKKIVGISELLENVSAVLPGAYVVRRLGCSSRPWRAGAGPRAATSAVVPEPSLAEALRRWIWRPVDPLTRRDPSETDLAWIEEEIGATLPAEYRGFLHTHGWTRFADAMTFPLAEPAPWGTSARMSSFLGFSSDIRRDLAFLISEGQAGVLPEGTVPIATDACGNLVLLGTTGSARDRVWLWDRECRGLDDLIDNMVGELEAEGIEIVDDDEHQIIRLWESMFPERRTRPLGFSNVYAVADSFADFLGSLRRADQ
jgi:hypothetical protein